MSQFCVTCGGIDFDQDEGTGAFRCSQCYTLSQNYQNCEMEHMAGVTFIGSRIAAKIGFVRETRRKDRRGDVFESKETNEEACLDLTKLYVRGLQTILLEQCSFLVNKMGVHPHAVSLLLRLWSKLLIQTRVFHSDWAQATVDQVESHYMHEKKRLETEEGLTPAVAAQLWHDSQHWAGNLPTSHYRKYMADNPDSLEGREDNQPRGRRGTKYPRTQHGILAEKIWLDELHRRLPLHATLSLCFLGCHLAREPVLPTELCYLALWGSLPYLTAWQNLPERGKYNHRDGSVSREAMWRPLAVPSAREVEWSACQLADRLGVDLPPVNYWEVTRKFSRWLNLPWDDLALPVRRLHSLHVPFSYWLSKSRESFPTRAHVMAVLIIAIKMVVPLHGRCSLSAMADGSPTASLLHSLLVPKQPFVDPEGGDQPEPGSGHARGLHSYLQYCQTVIFRGCRVSYVRDRLSRELWKVFDSSLTGQDRNDDLPVSKPVEEGTSVEATVHMKDTETQDEHADWNDSQPWGQFLSRGKEEEGWGERLTNKRRPAGQSTENYSGGDLPAAMATQESQAVDFLGVHRGRQQPVGSNSGREWSNGVEPPQGPIPDSPSVSALWGPQKVMAAMEACGFHPLQEENKVDGYVMYKSVEETMHVSVRPIGVHVDYFVLLHACASWIHVSPRALHSTVLEHEQDLMDLECDFTALRAELASALQSE